MTKRPITVAALILAFVGAVAVVSVQPSAQQSEAAFEIASVRRNLSGGRSSAQLPERGTVTGTNVSVYFMVLQAYGVNPFEVIIPRDNPLIDPGNAAPKFDFQIKPLDNALPGQSRMLLQRLLTDRFKLRMHRETRTVPVYALTVAREGRLGPELRTTEQNCAAWAEARRRDPQVAEPRDRRGTPLCAGPQPSPTVRLLRNAGPAANIARRIQSFLDRPLVDATGLTGNVEWTLRFAMNPLDPDTPSIFTAVQEQLGLTLESRTAPFEVLVIDSVEWPTQD